MTSKIYRIFPKIKDSAVNNAEKKDEGVSATDSITVVESKAKVSQSNTSNIEEKKISENSKKTGTDQAESNKQEVGNKEQDNVDETEATESKEITEAEENEPAENAQTPSQKEQAKREIVCISKMGSEHVFANMNNQDFTFNLLNMKIVTDGCGSGKHSEVGVRLFSQLFARKAKEYFDKGEAITEENFIDVVNDIFGRMLELCNDTSFIFQNYCFTILVCFELEDEFVVYSAGDGYIIKENAEGITFDKLDDGEYPSYYIYNFIEDKAILKEYKEGVKFKVTRCSKSEYSNVGVASDGLRFAENLLEVEKHDLKEYLHDGKGPRIKKLINKNNQKNGMFHDDISICF